MGPSLRGRHFDREIQLAAMTDVHDRRSGTPRAGRGSARPLRSASAWPTGRCVSATVRPAVQPLQRERQVRAALVVGDGVNFVHDDRLDVAQDGAAAVGGEQDVQRLRRGHQDVRRALEHLAPLFHQRVAGADGGANLRHQHAALGGQRQDFAQRAVEVLLDVVAQRLQRRDVEDFGAVVQRAVERFAHQAVNADEERRQRLARTGGRGDQRGTAGQNFGPALLLRLGRRTETREEPLGDERMRPRQRDRNFPHRHPDIIAGVFAYFRLGESPQRHRNSLTTEDTESTGRRAPDKEIDSAAGCISVESAQHF